MKRLGGTITGKPSFRLRDLKRKVSFRGPRWPFAVPRRAPKEYLAVKALWGAEGLFLSRGGALKRSRQRSVEGIFRDCGCRRKRRGVRGFGPWFCAQNNTLRRETRGLPEAGRLNVELSDSLANAELRLWRKVSSNTGRAVLVFEKGRMWVADVGRTDSCRSPNGAPSGDARGRSGLARRRLFLVGARGKQSEANRVRSFE